MAYDDCYNFWYAIQVRYRHEFFVSQCLQEKGFEILFPTYRSKRRWCDRWKEIELPLFSGYLFYEARPNISVSTVLTTSGVVKIVGTSKGPSPVDPAEIATLQTFLRSGGKAEPCEYIEIGSKVKIMEGPMAGVEGILRQYGNRHQLILSVKAVRGSISVEINPESVLQMKHPAHSERMKHLPAVAVEATMQVGAPIGK